MKPKPELSNAEMLKRLTPAALNELNEHGAITLRVRPIPKRGVSQFKLYPDTEKNNYIQVLIFEKHSALSRRLRASEHHFHRVGRAWAFYADYADRKTIKFSDRPPYAIGEMCFHLHGCTDNAVAHEFIHVVMAHARRNPGGMTEEDMAELHGELVSEFWYKFVDQHTRSRCWGWFKPEARKK